MEKDEAVATEAANAARGYQGQVMSRSGHVKVRSRSEEWRSKAAWRKKRLSLQRQLKQLGLSRSVGQHEKDKAVAMEAANAVRAIKVSRSRHGQ